MGIGGYSTIAGLRGEMGASLMRTRIMKSSLQFVREVKNGKFENIKEMGQDIIKMKKGNWYRMVNSYLKELEIDWKDIYEMTKEDINKMMKNYDTKLWNKTLEEKKTLKYYREGKEKMGYEGCYRNHGGSMLYAQARLNALKLEEAIGRGKQNYNQTCKVCGLEDEDLLHFMMKCPKLEKRRNQIILDNGIEEPEEKLIHFLYEQKNHQKKGKMIKDMWYARRSILKFKEESEKRNKMKKKRDDLLKSDPGPKRYVAMCNRENRGVSELRG